VAEPTILAVELPLEVIDDLFVEPELNPLKRQRLMRAALDELANRLARAGKPDQQLDLTITLPKGSDTPPTQAELEDAIDRYCRYQVDDLQSQIYSVKTTGRRQLTKGLILGAFLLLISAFGYYLTTNDNNAVALLGGMIGNVFSIALWVVVWHPVELLLYEPKPLEDVQLAYRQIELAKVRLAFRSEESSETVNRKHSE
jgi:hypothetical protein